MTERWTVTIPKPVVPYGPEGVDVDLSTAQYMRDVARRIDTGTNVHIGGSNVKATVSRLLRDVAEALETQPVSGPHDWKPTTNALAAWKCTRCGSLGWSPAAARPCVRPGSVSIPVPPDEEAVERVARALWVDHAWNPLDGGDSPTADELDSMWDVIRVEKDFGGWGTSARVAIRALVGEEGSRRD